MSSGPGPLCGSRPVEQITRYGRQAEVMSDPGAEMSGYVAGLPAEPRLEKSDTTPLRVPVPRSSYEATMMMPGVGSCPGGLVASLSGPSLPAAHTVRTLSLAKARCNLAVAEFGSNAPPPLGPYELLLTLIGGHPAHGLR